MNEALRQLVRLQDLMQALEGNAEKIAAVPSQVARLEKALLAAQAEVETGRAKLDDLQKKRRKLEGDLMEVESKIEKYQAQLLEVKTNKEYQAMLKEIDSCRRERGALDEKILLEMEEADERDDAFKEVEKRLEERRRDTEAGKRELADKLEALKGEKQALEEERERLMAAIPANYLEQFLRVARQRNGLALVPVCGELCGGCHVRVMPKLIQQVRREASLIACDSCKRFLYVLEENGPNTSPPGDRPQP